MFKVHCFCSLPVFTKEYTHESYYTIHSAYKAGTLWLWELVMGILNFFLTFYSLNKSTEFLIIITNNC